MTTSTNRTDLNLIPVNSITDAPEEARPALLKAKEKFGFVPNLLGMLSTNPQALNAYLSVGEAFEKSGLDPLEQQVVLLTTSIENKCGYCVAAHSTISSMMKLSDSVIHALRTNRPLENKKLESLRIFTAQIVRNRGNLNQAEISEFLSAGYDKSSILAVITAVAL